MKVEYLPPCAMDVLNSISDWLRQSYNIDVADDWLTTCVEFIHQETQNSPPSLDELKSLVFEQWLGSDLSEVGKPSLPDFVFSCEKCYLDHVYPLQVISILDVATPLFGQLQKFQSNGLAPDMITFSDNPFEAQTQYSCSNSATVRPSRMLKLEMTDGARTLQAIEYRPISSLHKDLPSGTKVVIKGHVLCRRQVMFLQEDNVCVLGGEVDDLMVVNNPLMNLQAEMEKNRQVLMSKRNL